MHKDLIPFQGEIELFINCLAMKDIYIEKVFQMSMHIDDK